MSARADLTGHEFGDYVTAGAVSSYEWRVSHKAPPQARKPFWAVEHAPCGRHVDIAHTLLVPLTKGKTVTLPPCTYCTPAAELPAISHGMHLACGQAHSVGTPCGKAGPGECQHGGPWRWCGTCAPLGGVTVEKMATGGTIIRPRAQALYVEGAIDGSPAALDLDALRADCEDDEGPRELDLDALDLEPLPPVIVLDLAAFLDVEALRTDCPRGDTCTCSASLEPCAAACPAAPAPAAVAASITALARGNALETGRATRHDAGRAHLDLIGAAISMPAKEGTGKAGMSALAGCERKLGYRLLLGRPAGGPAWRPFVGTAAHGRDQAIPEGDEWRGPINLSEIYRADNERRAAAGLPARWLIGVKVTEPAWGEVDLFDVEQGEVIDWKVPGITTVKKAWGGNVAENYQGQVQLNGRALELLGHTVRRVSVLLLPAAGELHDAAWWSAPYDREAAIALIARRDRIMAMHAAATAAGHADPASVVLSLLSIREDYCARCPAFGAHCAGAVPVVEPAAPRGGGLELVR